ncbi:MAG: hypothetical protein KJ666_00655 [Bacteroidetes bacterium]|nr:hypothetical protein [Bacteroidota bacterium]MBU2584852.1 hypothetical protein [Bacteroidota bacterium]
MNNACQYRAILWREYRTSLPAETMAGAMAGREFRMMKLNPSADGQIAFTSKFPEGIP